MEMSLSSKARGVEPFYYDFFDSEQWELARGYEDICQCIKCGRTFLPEYADYGSTVVCPECKEEMLWEDAHDYFAESIQPMMNIVYPLPGILPSVQDLLVISNLPVVVVSFSHIGGAFLALTGGGMDLSPQIAEAYIRLGFLPPVHLAYSICDWGREYVSETAWEATKESLSSAIAYYTGTLKIMEEKEKGV